jgi:hypothetical protein
MAAVSAGRTWCAVTPSGVEQQHIAAVALHQGSHHAGPPAQDQVAFPMAGHRPVGRLGRRLAAVEGVAQLAAALGQPLGPQPATGGQQLLAEAVEPVDLGPPGGQHHHLLGWVVLGLLPGRPPVLQQGQGGGRLGVGGHHPVVRLIRGDGLVDQPTPDKVTDVVAEDQLSPEDRAERGAWVGCIAGALSRSEYKAGLTAAGFTEVSVAFTHQVGDGLHSAIVKATKPVDASPAIGVTVSAGQAALPLASQPGCC